MRRQSHTRRPALSFPTPASGPSVAPLTVTVEQALMDGSEDTFNLTATVSGAPDGAFFIWSAGDAAGGITAATSSVIGGAIATDVDDFACVAISTDLQHVIGYGYTSHTVTA